MKPRLPPTPKFLPRNRIFPSELCYNLAMDVKEKDIEVQAGDKELSLKEIRKGNLIKNIFILAGSIVAAILFAKSGIAGVILTETRELEILASFLGGIFFTSLFTAAPATVVLAEIAQANSVFTVAFFGALGSILGDLILFKFLKAHLGDELVALFSHPKSERLLKLFHLNIFHWLMVFVGAIIVASPLPDELGLVLMGITEIKPKYLIPLSFGLNFIGILIIGLIARGIS